MDLNPESLLLLALAGEADRRSIYNTPATTTVTGVHARDPGHRIARYHGHMMAFDSSLLVGTPYYGAVVATDEHHRGRGSANPTGGALRYELADLWQCYGAHILYDVDKLPWNGGS